MTAVVRTGPSLLTLCAATAFDVALVNRLLGAQPKREEVKEIRVVEVEVEDDDVIMLGTEEGVEFTKQERLEQAAALKQLELAHQRGIAQREKDVITEKHRRFKLDFTKTFPDHVSESMVGNMYVNPLGLPIPCGGDKVWAENFHRLEASVDANQFAQGMFLDDQFMSFAVACARESYGKGIILPVTFVPYFTDVRATLGTQGLIDLTNSPAKAAQYLKGFRKLRSLGLAPFLSISETIRGYYGHDLKDAPFIGVFINITDAHWLFAIYHPAMTIEGKTNYNLLIFDPLKGQSTRESYIKYVRAVREFVVAFYTLSLFENDPDHANPFFVDQAQTKETFFVRHRPQQRVGVGGTNNCGIYAALFAINFLRSMSAEDRDVTEIAAKVVSGIYDESQLTRFAHDGGMRPEDVRRKMAHNWIQVYKRGQ